MLLQNILKDDFAILFEKKIKNDLNCLCTKFLKNVVPKLIWKLICDDFVDF